MGPSVEAFRPDDPLTASELAVVVSSLGGRSTPTPMRCARPLRELDARLVSLAGLRPEAQLVRQSALDAGIAPRPWLGTETIARLLRLRINHPREEDELELQVTQPVTRAEAAYSIATYMKLSEAKLEATRTEADAFSPLRSASGSVSCSIALRLVGSPYVWAGTSEKPQQLFGKLPAGRLRLLGVRLAGLQDEAVRQRAPGLSRVLVGRTTYAMSGEVPRSLRVGRDALAPGDVVFFGSRGPRSKPSEIGHMIYVGNDWFVHSSRFGTTLTPMTDWYETSFAGGGAARRSRSRVRPSPACAEEVQPAPSASRSVRLTSPERVLFPDDGLTKEDLFEYYRAIAPVLVRTSATGRSR